METNTPAPSPVSAKLQINFENIIKYQYFDLIKDNIIYKIFVGIDKNYILIKSRKYMIELDEEEFSSFINQKIYNIEKAYDILVSLFEEDNIYIKKIIKNESIMLIIINNEKENSIELKYRIINEDYIFNQINQINELKQIKDLKNEIEELKHENIILKNEIKNGNNTLNNENNILKNKINELKDEIKELKKKLEICKKIPDNNNNVPKNLELLTDLVNDSYVVSTIDNSFVVFKSINNILYLIYSNFYKSLLCYDINKKMKIREIKEYHKEYISNFRHYLDEKNIRDLVMSISAMDNRIKILNVNTWECIFDKSNLNEVGSLYSACFLNDNKNNYIVTSNRSKKGIIEPIKIFDLNGEKIKEIKNSNESTLFIDIYNDKIISKNFIITGNTGYSKSYDYSENKVYQIYNDNESASGFGHFSIAINSYKETIELIDSCFDGKIRIFNFHSGLLLKKIKINDGGLRSICLWNDNYLYVACDDKTIKLIELKNGLVINTLKGHNKQVITIKKINHPEYGECLVSQNKEASQIKLWVCKK